MPTPNDDDAGPHGTAAGPARRANAVTGRQRAGEGLCARGARAAAEEAGGAGERGAFGGNNESGAVLAAGDVRPGLFRVAANLVPPGPPRPAGTDAEPAERTHALIRTGFA